MTEDIYVVKGLKEPLMGQPAIEKLNLLARINEIQFKVTKKGLKRNTLNCSKDWENLRESMKSS